MSSHHIHYSHHLSSFFSTVTVKVRPSTTTTTTTVTTTTTPPPTTQVPFIPPNLNVSPFRPPPHTIHTTLPNNYFPTNPTTTHRPSHPSQRFPPTVSINIPPSTTTTTTTTTKRPPTVSTKKTVNRHHPFDNEISDSTSAVRSGPGKSSRLNTGGIIALGFFGGFVFLAAVIVVVVIIFRRYDYYVFQQTVFRIFLFLKALCLSFTEVLTRRRGMRIEMMGQKARCHEGREERHEA